MNQYDTFGLTDGIRTPSQVHVEDAARQRLSVACPYVQCFEKISLDFADGVLTLRGQLSNFYLKQVLQEYLRGMECVARIDDQVDVVGAGDDSVGRSTEPFRSP